MSAPLTLDGRPAYLGAPQRRVVEVIDYRQTAPGHYLYRYRLACGHIVERREGGRQKCHCADCRGEGSP